MYNQASLKFYKNDYIHFGRNKDIATLKTLSNINVASIDPAIKNFALRLESRSRRSVTTIYMNKVKFEDDTSVYSQITTYLDEFNEDFLDVHITLIERQMSVNYNMIRVSQHCLTYFAIKYPNMIVL